jgi:DNA invertase Pin-like site-specific DNA recombinase
MEQNKSSIRRCAIYTRKSSEEGLEQDFNSLHAQREACEAFIKSQAGEGWHLIKTGYDDGGVSGGTMDRPALQQLLADIRRALVDVVVVYKVDRPTRSLADFAKMVEVFDAQGVSFVAVTQQFNTTTSMGRLTLNVLLSFAQFEREVTGERIRDKIAASKKKGMWMGGMVPIGYDVVDRRLVINETDAETVRSIFRQYAELGCVRLLKEDLDRRGIVTNVRTSRKGTQSGGRPFSRGALYKLLSNPIYIGEIRHKTVCYPGQHEAIIDRELWDKTRQQALDQTTRRKALKTKAAPSPLMGRLFDESGECLTPSHAVKGERRYRYYVSKNLMNGAADDTQRGWRIPAPEIERTVASAAQQILSDQTLITAAIQDTGSDANRMPSIFKAAEACIRRLQSETDAAVEMATLIERVDLRQDGIRVSLKLPMPTIEERDVADTNKTVVAQFLPMRVKRRGVEMRLVIEGGHASIKKADPVLLKAIARGHRWFDDLVSGRAASTVEIAKRHRLGERHVRRLIRLAFLSPTIVEAVAEGRQPPDLHAETLKHFVLPLEWSTQKRDLGIE